MFGAIDGSLLIEYGREMGVMWQLDLDLDTPPEYTLPFEYFTNLRTGYESIPRNSGSKTSFIGSTDHPGFTEFRNSLEDMGYIKTSRSTCNGDVILKRFKMNNIWMEVDDRFLCASALKWHVAQQKEATLAEEEMGKIDD